MLFNLLLRVNALDYNQDNYYYLIIKIIIFTVKFLKK